MKPARLVHYEVIHFCGGSTLMLIAGLMSGLLGIGSGALKVIAMDHFMRLPLKVSSATSNFMIGVTAGAGALVFLARGDVPTSVAAPGCARGDCRRDNRQPAPASCECTRAADGIRGNPGSDRG